MVSVAVVPAAGVVYDRFGSDSHVTVPAAVFLMNLYWIAVLGGSATVNCQTEPETDFAVIASAVFHDPRAGTEPTRPG